MCGQRCIFTITPGWVSNVGRMAPDLVAPSSHNSDGDKAHRIILMCNMRQLGRSILLRLHGGHTDTMDANACAGGGVLPLLLNARMLALNQDPLGQQARRVWREATRLLEVSKQLQRRGCRRRLRRGPAHGTAAPAWPRCCIGGVALSSLGRHYDLSVNQSP